MAKFIFNAGVFKDSPLFAASTATLITVLDRADDTLASLWSDRAGSSILANPHYISSPGKIAFYLDAGRYRVTATNGGFTQVWEDVLIIDPDAGGGGGGGATDFTDLDDVPSSYTGQAGELVRVNSDETSLEFTQYGPPLTIATASASYALALSNWHEFKQITGSGTVDIEIPLDATLDLPIGYTHLIRPRDDFSGVCTWTKEDPAVTLEAPGGQTLVSGAGLTSAVTKIAANTWVVYGRTEEL